MSQVCDLLSRGDLAAARTAAQRALVADPNSAAARYEWGLVKSQSGDYSQAVHWLSAAVEQAPADARYHCNLGQALLQAGDPGRAIESLRRAIVYQPGYEVARYNLGCALLEQGDPAGAAEIFEVLLSEFPQHAEYHCAHADALRAQGQWRRAISSYRHALSTDVGHARAEGNLGALLVAFGKGESALQHCLRAVELSPNSALAHLNLGRCLLQLEQLDEAMDAFADGHALEPGHVPLCLEIAHCWRARGDDREAASWYARVVELDPGNASATAGAALILLGSGDSAGALALLRERLKSQGDDAELISAYVEALWDEGDADAALQQLEILQSKQPDNAALLARAGQIMASSGRTEEAGERFFEALDKNPRCVPALHGLAVDNRATLETGHRREIEKLLAKGKLNLASQARLHNALAYYYDGIACWQTAAEHMATANRLQWEYHSARDWDYDFRAHEKNFCRIKSSYNTEYFERVRDFGIDTLEPVFIVGMPRSGTTLTEQILARHPQVLGIGERNFLAQSHRMMALESANTSAAETSSPPLDRLAQLEAPVVRRVARAYLSKLGDIKQRAGAGEEVRRVVDKMPDNYSLLGWIVTLFPHAKIIHCRRSPRDVALSCWLTQFGKIQWASRIPDLLHRIEQYQLMMDWWRQCLTGKFIEVEYESMVADQEGESRRLLDWLELDWNEDCLRYYESDRLVRTASINQVRQPIYTRSVQRWQPYVPYIPELEKIPL